MAGPNEGRAAAAGVALALALGGGVALAFALRGGGAPVRLVNAALLPPGAVVVATIEGCAIYAAGDVLAWESNLAIDADGDPQAYHPDDWGDLHGRLPVGLDAPENAGAFRGPTGKTWPSWVQVKRWWGVVVGPGGLPVLQGQDDPAPGYFVSTTSLVDPAVSRAVPARYASSRDVPYIAVPPEILALGVKMGDLCHVSANGVTVSAVVADQGPPGKIGEGSIALARDLGLEIPARMARILGVSGAGRSRERGIFFKVFKGSGLGKLLTAEEVRERGATYA